ncbi:Nuclear protein localization protein 4 like [Schistosoma japonicum]|nr:Nuclear protein localization protein 4 like [Schistosoma japonicum]
MIIRIQSPNGTQRIELPETETYGKLLGLVCEKFGINQNDGWCLSRSHDQSGRLNCHINTHLSKFGLKHGDLLFLLDHTRGDGEIISKNDRVEPAGNYKMSQSDSNSDHTWSTSELMEDKVDQEMAKMDGRIHRKRNEQLCHHPVSGQCIHCVPLEPFDSAYLEHLDPPVKFMSFHAYLRKFSYLENLSCHIRSGCRDHPPWPDGICTKCQPNPVTLEIQPYRHVDFVQFENPQLMDRFLDFWRQTSCQRIGIMLGRYAHFDAPGSPPLAIKAVVAAIYEPIQESTPKSVKLIGPLDNVLPKHVIEVAGRIGLQPVGWIFTDLVAQNSGGNGVDTFFLSAEECITAARLQNLHPNICRLSPDGCFGSKFTTVVVTGDSSNHIHFEGYQVSNQAMALEKDNILVPTYDAPELGYIRETTKVQFVPEVFYATKDKYGNRVTRVARPLPVEFLLTSMPTAFPIEPVYTMAKLPEDFPANCQFPIENRECLGQIQDIPSFARILHKFGMHQLHLCLSNFHILAWLVNNDTLGLQLFNSEGKLNEDPYGITGLLNAIALGCCRSSNSMAQCEIAVNKWASESPIWATVQELANAVVSDMPPSPPLPTESNSYRSAVIGSNVSVGVGPTSMQKPSWSSQTTSNIIDIRNSEANHWACSHCTFHNSPDTDECEMCRLPRSG